MTGQDVDRMSFWQVCAYLKIEADHYQFAKAYRRGLISERIWIEKYLVVNMVLAVAVDELAAKIDTVLARQAHEVEADG